MPLETAPVGSPGFGRNIATERAAGKPEDQAVAIAYSKAGERKDGTDIASGIPLNAKLDAAESDLREEMIRRENALDRAKREGKSTEALERQFRQTRDAYKKLKNERLNRSDADGTDVASGIPLNAKLDSLFAAADTLYSRADAMETGRWDGDVQKGKSPFDIDIKTLRWELKNGNLSESQKQRHREEIKRMERKDAVGWGMGTADLRRKINDLKKEVEDLRKEGRDTSSAEEELKEYKKEYAKY